LALQLTNLNITVRDPTKPSSTPKGSRERKLTQATAGIDIMAELRMWTHFKKFALGRRADSY
jgi:hypothetical protein